MLKKNAHYFFALGIEVGMAVKAAKLATQGVSWESERLFLDRALKKFQKDPFVPDAMRASQKAAAELVAMLDDLPGKGITYTEEGRFRTKLDEFDTTLGVDLDALSLYYVPPRLAYATDKLIDEGLAIFPESVHVALPKEARADIKEATRCLAFGLPTAVAFHILRAAESVMLAYFDVLSLTLPNERSWAAYIRALNTRQDLPDGLTSRLGDLRKYERNELMHPAKFLKDDEAYDLFDYVKSAMLVILRDIAARRPQEST
jgi:hypothetical protein